MPTHHGQGDGTEEKQNQLRELLQSCYYAWEKERAWAHPKRLFIDCMSGSGHATDGSPGSPIILQDFAGTLPETQVVWCDVNLSFTAQLESHKQGNTELLTGLYQIEVRKWLAQYARRHRLVQPFPNSHRERQWMGLVYLDDNGCKQIWQDDDFLEWVLSSFPYLDVAIHFSETAHARSKGAGIQWALDNSVMDIARMILTFKPESVIYTDESKWKWRLIYAVKSTKMNLKGSKREKLRDYVKRMVGRDAQASLFSLPA